MVTRIAFTALVAAVAIERLVEMRLARRNVAIQRAAGGREYGARHYPIMVLLHVLLLAGSVGEVWLLSRPFIPLLGYSMLALVVLSAAGRFWVIRTLGDRWTTRVIVVPGRPVLTTGPYRFLTHPNYLVVAVEGFALPLIHSSWITAAVFTAANGILLRERIRVEDAALAEGRQA